jgi:DNA-binding NarL/FixJ family response regulator
MTQAPPSRIRLMVVDDHEVVRIGLRALFGRSKTIEVVAEAGSIAEAIRVAREAHPEVVLMDLRLPDGSGIEACREILATEPSTRILFLTSFPDEQAVTATILAGAAGYLLKEIGQEALRRAIEAVASGKSILDPTVTQSVLTRLQEQAERPNGRRGADLSAQEYRICALVVEGKTNKEIAAVLGLSDKTVKNYLSNAFQKLRVSRRSQAAAVFSRRMNNAAQD